MLIYVYKLFPIKKYLYIIILYTRYFIFIGHCFFLSEIFHLREISDKPITFEQFNQLTNWSIISQSEILE